MAEPIEMPFGMLSRVDPRNRVLDGCADALTGRDTFTGVREVSDPLQSTGFRGIGSKSELCKNGRTDLNGLYVV